MNKVSGKKSDFRLVKEDASRVVIGYGLTKISSVLYEWREVYIYKKQQSSVGLTGVKSAILGDINARVQDKILCGFTWQDDNGDTVVVWLSAENQRNYSEAQRLAALAGAENYTPVKFKIGEDEGGEPKYRTFDTLESLNEFCTAVFTFIHTCLTEGWTEKDGIDWEPYEQIFTEKD